MLKLAQPARAIAAIQHALNDIGIKLVVEHPLSGELKMRLTVLITVAAASLPVALQLFQSGTAQDPGRKV